MRKPIRQAALVLLLVSLAGCGFQLRGADGALSLEGISPLFISGLAIADPFTQVLRSNLRGSDVALVEQASAAKETLSVFNHKREKKVHSIGARGRVLEYALTERLSFSLGGMPGRFEQESAEVLSVRRVYTNPETETLGRQYEENQLRRDMYQELATKLIRRMASKVSTR
jgi:LPS-assembly lipoprotein